MEFDAFGNKISLKDDGTTSVITKAGSAIEIDANGCIKANLSSIKSVGIHNLIDVQTYNMTIAAGMTSHFVRFRDGGEVSFAYNDAGKLVNFSATKVAFTLRKGNELLFKCHS